MLCTVAVQHFPLSHRWDLYGHVVAQKTNVARFCVFCLFCLFSLVYRADIYTVSVRKMWNALVKKRKKNVNKNTA